jgi:hypothetical protein
LALAACLALCFLAGWVIKHAMPADESPNRPMFVDKSADGTPSNEITRDTKTAIAVVAPLDGVAGPGVFGPVNAGELLTASDQERLLVRIDDRHEVTVESGTRLTLNRTPDAGFAISLSAGKITASVNRSDGEGAFLVRTPQSVVTVMGTVFTVESDPKRTVLNVSEGVVEFASRQGETRMVSAGETFVTDGGRLARSGSNDTLPIHALIRRSIDETADARSFLQSPYCRERFAPLLHLGEYLRSQGVEADDLTLLAVSADLWCLQYPKDPDAGLPPFIHRKAGLERAAKYYGYEVNWVNASNAADVQTSAQRALANGNLVLGYGYRGYAVEQLNTESLAAGDHGRFEPYRFLEEAKTNGLVLARISRAAEVNMSEQEIATAAISDMQRLLAGVEDCEYLTGEPALEMWARRAVEFERLHTINDFVLHSLNTLGKLSVPCSRELDGASASTHMPATVTLCRTLERHLNNALHDSTMFDGTCGQQRINLHLESLQRILAAFQEMKNAGGER